MVSVLGQEPGSVSGLVLGLGLELVSVLGLELGSVLE